MSRRHPHVVNVDEIEPKVWDRGPRPSGPRFAGQRRSLGRATGGRQLGCSHLVVPPGATAWPRHAHASNEEAIYVLSGTGRLRLGEAQVELRTGDWAALVAGPEAHQLINDGEDDLVYLCVSTMHACDVGVYPDSGKVGVFGGAAPGGEAEARFVSGFFRAEAAVDYFDGEG